MSDIVIKHAKSSADLDAVRRLIREFVAWAYSRYSAERSKVAGYFDSAAFEQELHDLPGKYAAPGGRLLLSELNGVAVGCVAFRKISPGVCEMKRLFVAPSVHGRGIGRTLVTRLIREAKEAGYRVMRLDTGPGQPEAFGLYRSLGFKQIMPYYDLPRDMASWLVFMELNLTDDVRRA